VVRTRMPGGVTGKARKGIPMSIYDYCLRQKTAELRLVK
jgi:hypothetical protein